MFVTVKYGDEKEQLFNAYCRNNVFLQFVKSRCHCQAEDIIDVSDQFGRVKQLHRNPNDYAKDYLRAREHLILLSIRDIKTNTSEGETNMKKITYKPMLLSLARNQEFIDMLNSQSEDASLEPPTCKLNMGDTEDSKMIRSKQRLSSSSKRISARRGVRLSSLRKN